MKHPGRVVLLEPLDLHEHRLGMGMAQVRDGDLSGWVSNFLEPDIWTTMHHVDRKLTLAFEAVGDL